MRLAAASVQKRRPLAAASRFNRRPFAHRRDACARSRLAVGRRPRAPSAAVLAVRRLFVTGLCVGKIWKSLFFQNRKESEKSRSLFINLS